MNRSLKSKAARSIAVVAVLGCIAMLGQPAQADSVPLTISDGIATAVIDPANGAGMYDWEVGGIDHLVQQWFWYRVGAEGPETNISALYTGQYVYSDLTWDGIDDAVAMRFQDPGQFTIDVRLLLAGGTPGSGTSDVAEIIKIVNDSSEPLEFHFFQYCDLNLMGTVTDTSLEITNGNSASQKDGSAAVSETVETPPASHFQAGVGSATLDSLNDAAPTTLGDVAGPLGPGDLNWSFEWDFVLQPGGTYIISKDKHVVPEPGAMSLLALGGLAFVVRRKKK